MPEISRFYGIIVRMYTRDHPPPHIHVRYAEHEAMIDIRSAQVLAGELPRRALRLIREWIDLRRHELEADWALAEAGHHVQPVPPLP